MRDGVELSANIWRPIDADAEPVPAILELIPYGKDNWRRNADTGRGEWFAARGYALCPRRRARDRLVGRGRARRVHARPRPRTVCEAVAWLAAQPWCTGAVGMWGISYGAFTAIQVAKRRPPALKAIAPFQGTDDRYRTDVHLIGGCVTASELSQYAVSQVAMNAMPPDAAFRGEAWLDEWRARLDATPPWLVEWLRQQTDGPYWRPGSLAPDYDAIEAAILNVGGWCDAYVDAAFRMQAACTAPSRTIVGNWVHGWPHDSPPGPNLDELHEVVRFFDRWLKGEPNGADREPALVWFERDYAEPEPFPEAWPGRWRATTAFPHPATRETAWAFAGGSRRWSVGSSGGEGTGGPAASRPVPAPADHRHARRSLSWGAGGEPNGLARDLRPDESLGPTYTTEPLDAPVSVLGEPVVVLHLAVARPVATAVVRLSDVAPDGTSAWVSAGILNLTHRRSHEDPEPLDPGRVEEVRVPLAPRRLPVRARASDPRVGGVVGVAGHLALTVRRRVRAAPRPGDAVAARAPGHPRGRWPGRRAGPDVQDHAAGPPRGRRGGRHRRRARWRIEEDVIAGTTTVTDPRRWRGRPRGWSPTLCRRDASPDRLRPGPRHRDDRRARRLSLDGRRSPHRDPRRQRPDERRRFLDLTVDLTVDLDGERFFERTWHERISRHLV